MEYDDLQVPDSSGSDYAAANRNRILSDAIPALTLPIGANYVTNLDVTMGGTVNSDMETASENGFPNGRPVITIGTTQFWEWHHSDICAVAYPFTYNLFNTIVNEANLK